MKKARPGKHQYAALGLRADDHGAFEILLITSRGTGRWVIPKGSPMQGKTPLEAAMIEAYEEAGAIGRALSNHPVGRYRHRKVMRSGLEANLRVGIFAILVDQMLEEWPERSERTVKWFSFSEAAALVAEPALAKVIRRAARMHVGLRDIGGPAGRQFGSRPDPASNAG
jgi:8-oxo-dGTP pyrophosphatase MutT (NUDIX family)